MTAATDAAYDDMAFARILVDAVEHGCTYEDRCIGVRAILKRHREAAEHRARLEGMEIMREAAVGAVHHSLYAVGRLKALDPATILAQRTRA